MRKTPPRRSCRKRCARSASQPDAAAERSIACGSGILRLEVRIPPGLDPVAELHRINLIAADPYRMRASDLDVVDGFPAEPPEQGAKLSFDLHAVRADVDDSHAAVQRFGVT